MHRVHDKSSRFSAFRERYFPAASEGDWSDWRWQMRHRFRLVDDVARFLRLDADEQEAFAGASVPISLTPYYAALIDPDDPGDPIRKTMIPRRAENIVGPGELSDPLGEEGHRPVPGIIHTYPDKVLFLVTDHCATYCRYCTRGRVVGSGELPAGEAKWRPSLDYIRAHAQIRDVLLSGGDPLTLGDDQLGWLITELAAIPHVELIRIGSKIPPVLPQRITPGLISALRQFTPIWLSIHFTHPRELTPELQAACDRLAEAGIPMGSQTVLLKGVNDSIETIKVLMQGLLRCRVTPYYLHQCDAIVGSAHFRTPIQQGQESHGPCRQAGSRKAATSRRTPN